MGYRVSRRKAEQLDTVNLNTLTPDGTREVGRCPVCVLDLVCCESQE